MYYYCHAFELENCFKQTVTFFNVGLGNILLKMLQANNGIQYILQNYLSYERTIGHALFHVYVQQRKDTLIGSHLYWSGEPLIPFNFFWQTGIGKRSFTQGAGAYGVWSLIVNRAVFYIQCSLKSEVIGFSRIIEIGVQILNELVTLYMTFLLPYLIRNMCFGKRGTCKQLQMLQ